MENPQSQASEIWRSNAVKYDLQNYVLTDMASRLLDMTFNREIRERLSAAYHAGAEGELDNDGTAAYVVITGDGKLNPDKAADAIPEFMKGMNAAVKSPNVEDLNKVRQILLKQADVDAKTNSYWSGILSRYNRYGVDFYTDYKKVVESVTPTMISEFLSKTVLKSGNHIEVIMSPKK